MAKRTTLTQKQQALLAAKRQFAALFVSGTPHTRGDWDVCNETVGGEFKPCDRELRKLISDAGGMLPPCEEDLQPQVVERVIRTTEAMPANVVVQQPYGITPAPSLPAEDEAKADKAFWCDKWKVLEKDFDEIVKGTKEVPASSMRAMMSVQDRCFGKVGDEARERKVSGVLILPTLGAGDNMHICPRCGFTEEKLDQG